MIWMLILAFLVIGLVEVPTMVIQGHRRELRAFWGVMGIAFGLSLMAVMRWQLPSLGTLLRALMTPAARLLGLG